MGTRMFRRLVRYADLARLQNGALKFCPGAHSLQYPCILVSNPKLD